MPIQSTHPEYQEHYDIVERTKEAYEGEVLDFIPRLKGMTQQEYDDYRGRSSYYNVVERTLVALLGALTRKPHTIEGVYNEDPVVEGAGTMKELVQQCYAELLLGGRIGLMCDFNDALGTPYILKYNSESITNWGDDFVILREYFYAQDPKDKYVTVKMCRYRELFLDDSGYYAVRVWNQEPNANGSYKVTNKTQFTPGETIEPTYRGRRLDFIPFIIVTPYDSSEDLCKPPLSTIADINIEHFKLSTDIAHGAHFVALPTAVIAGDIQGEGTQLAIGGKQIWHLTQGSSATYLEFTGTGLSFLLDLQKEKETQMYNLGSRMLQFKAGVESSDALQIRLGAEGASLTAIASSLEQGFTKVLEMYNMWNGAAEGAVTVELNKDFTPANMQPDQIRTLIEAYNQNVISLDTLLQRLYEGEVVDNVDEEKTKISGTDPTTVTPTV